MPLGNSDPAPAPVAAPSWPDPHLGLLGAAHGSAADRDAAPWVPVRSPVPAFVVVGAQYTLRATHSRARKRLAVPREDLSLVTFHRGLTNSCQGMPPHANWKSHSPAPISATAPSGKIDVSPLLSSCLGGACKKTPDSRPLFHSPLVHRNEVNRVETEEESLCRHIFGNGRHPQAVPAGCQLVRSQFQ